MQQEYNTVNFSIGLKTEALPSGFHILTAFNPMDKQTTKEQNNDAHQALKKELAQLPVPMFEITLHFDHFNFSEPGFASTARLHTIYDLAVKYSQYALYSINGDELSIITCDDASMALVSGGFREKLARI